MYIIRNISKLKWTIDSACVNFIVGVLEAHSIVRPPPPPPPPPLHKGELLHKEGLRFSKMALMGMENINYKLGKPRMGWGGGGGGGV